MGALPKLPLSYGVYIEAFIINQASVQVRLNPLSLTVAESFRFHAGRLLVTSLRIAVSAGTN